MSADLVRSRAGMFTLDQAQEVWDALRMAKHSATLGYVHHENLMPADLYSVVVPVGPGIFAAADLRAILAIAERHGCEAHLIGDGLRIMPARKSP